MSTLIIKKLIRLLEDREYETEFRIKDKEYRIRIIEYATYFQFVISILLDFDDMPSSLSFPLSGIRFIISPDNSRNTSSVLKFSNKEDIFDTLNSDDISLVLKYGRGILDENILKHFIYDDIIEVEDLENFLNLWSQKQAHRRS